jgi:hypothetical protein
MNGIYTCTNIQTLIIWFGIGGCCRYNLQLKYETEEVADYDDDDFCNCFTCRNFRNILFFNYRRLEIYDIKNHEMLS